MGNPSSNNYRPFPLIDWMRLHPRCILEVTLNENKNFYAQLIDVNDTGATFICGGNGLDPKTAILDLETDLRSKTQAHFRTSRNGEM